jgi:hypothetical protein
LYEWTDFKKISTGAWIDSTWHGKSSPVKVEIENQEHPITKGLLDFYIFDELWVNSEQNEKFHVLGSAINKGVTNKGLKKQPAIFVSNFGKGRIFHTLLGHNMRSMRNTGFQTLILRGAEWAANKKVTLPIPKELQQSKASDLSEFTWLENDSTFALFENDQVLWRFNFNTFHGKPFFHPIYINSNRITCVSPDDHPWHLGLWFSWKYINGKNYWEYIGESCESEGITEIKSAKLEKMADYMAKITLKINYYTSKQEVVLNETRIIHVSSPKKDGRIHMDYDFNFEALADSVDLNRTPLLGEPEGKSWGGYAGLSIRFNQDFMNSKIISSFGEDNDVNGKIGDWLYMGFKGFDGNLVGSAIMIPGETKREGEAWYSVNNPEFPFYYFSPAYLYLKPQLLKKGERIKLKYRILHLEGDVKREELKNEYDNYLNSITN